MKTDIEIAQETTLRRIDDIAKELGITVPDGYEEISAE